MTEQLIKQPERQMPILANCDVLVIGGGPAGVAASVAASRLGARVILAEAESFLGGLGTGGSVLLWPGFCSKGSYAFGGISLEIIRSVEKLGGVYYGRPHSLCRHGYATFDSELLKYVLQEKVLDADVRLIQHMTAVDAVMNDARIDAVIFNSKAGYGGIRAKIFIDATGDGDLIAFSGVSHQRGIMPISTAWCIGGISFDGYELGKEEPFAEIDMNTWSPGKNVSGFYKKWRQICKSLNIHVADPVPMPNCHSIWTDGILLSDLDSLDPADLTKADVEGRRQAVKLLLALRKEMPGFENAFIYQFSTLTGVRIGRLLDGCYIITDEDIEEHHTFEDCVGIADQNMGKYNYFEIPYRCLLPKDVSNLLVSGRCISVMPPRNRFLGAFQEIREIPHCMVTGQAAGVAAAISAKEGKSPCEIDIPKLQAHLKEQSVRFTPDDTIEISDTEPKIKSMP